MSKSCHLFISSDTSKIEMSMNKECETDDTKEIKDLVESVLDENSLNSVSNLRRSLNECINFSEEKICDRYRLKTSVYAHRALGEYPTNTVDSLILNRKQGDRYDSCSDACSELVEEQDRVVISLDGGNEETDVMVSDNAYGQSKNNFDRFVKLGDEEEQKRKFDFVHGCRGKGHLVSLNNCEYKVVVSSQPSEDCWTVTFMYEYENEYYYVRDDDEFMTFTGELDCGGDVGKKTHGTVFHHVDYDVPYRGTTSSFRKFVRNFSHGVVNPFVPIQITDRQDEDMFFEYGGLQDYVRENESVFDFIGSSSVECSIGTLDTFVAVPKDDVDTGQKRILHKVVSTSEDSVLLAVDGQTHYKSSNSLLTNRLDFDEIGDKAIVLCRLESKNASNLFDDDRESFRQRSTEKMFKEKLVESLENMEELDKINTDRLVKPPSGSSESNRRRLDDLSDRDEVDLKNVIDADELKQVHKKNLNRISKLKNAPVAEKILMEHEDKNVFDSMEEILRSGRSYVDRRSIKQGKDVNQAGKSAAGQLFEILCYTQFVELCEGSKYVCHYEPSLDEIPGLNPLDSANEPDMDIVLVDESEDTAPVYVFSLKTSLKERIKQSAFWRLKMKIPGYDNSATVFSELQQETLFESKERPIKYGYLSPVWSGGSSSGILDDFDFGFVPQEKHTEQMDSQFKISNLTDSLKTGRSITKSV